MTDYTAYVQAEYGSLVGKTIKRIRAMHPSEMDIYGWDDIHPAIVIFLDDDTAIVPSCDPEGNGHGHLFIEDTEVR